MPEAAKLVSIVVPCRNEKGHISHFLDNVLAQKGICGDWEILVADGNSDDGTAGALADLSAAEPRLTVIANPAGIVSTGLNLAIARAAGEYVVRMDVHTQYADDYVASCIAVARETGAANVGGAARTRAAGPWASAIAAAYGSPFAVGPAKFHFESYEGEVDTVTYGCWPRAVLLELGGFDEALVRNQDDELNLRIRKSGGVIWQSSRIRSWYCPRENLGSLFGQYYQYGYWKVAVIRKHRLPASWRHLVPGAMVVGSLVALGLGFVWSWLHVALVAMAGLYVAFLGIGSWRICRGNPAVGFRYVLPTLVAFHWSYGLGFLAGWLRAGRGSGPSGLTR